VVVVGVATGHDISAQDLATSVTEYFPLAPDALVAIESGRSAVVQIAVSEHIARRAATMLIKLGAEIRIEPDGVGPGPLDFDDIDLGEITEGLGELELDSSSSRGAGFTEEGPTIPVISEERFPSSVLVDRPPVNEDADHRSPPPSAHRSKHTTRELDPVKSTGPKPRLDPAADPDSAPVEVATGATAATEADPEAERGQLVRCPAHGLLYDATQSAGCTRCLGPSAEQPFRVAPELRQRPRLWLTLGITLGLLLGAVPAALYAQNVKSGALYERRIEADAIRRTRSGSKHFKKQYAKARAKIAATRNRGIAVSALLWIGIAAALMLLWYRFV